MSIVIQVNTDLEQRLRASALQKGIEVEQYISSFLEHLFPSKTPASIVVPDREAVLLQQLNLDVQPEQWQLYLKLKAKRKRTKLSKNQQIQFIQLCEVIEHANVKRMTVLAELAMLKKVPIRILMQQLGLAPHHE
ncbi:MAG: hypothetical protein RLZZ628_1564 [Bacteroidota bacterium]|jgi:hypothetical protein